MTIMNGNQPSDADQTTMDSDMNDAIGNDQSLDQDWDQISCLWQASTPFEGIDLQKLAGRLRFVWWRMRILALLELCAGIFATIFFALLLFQDHLGGFLTGLFGVPWMIISTVMGIGARNGAWRSAREEPDDMIRLEIARLKSAIRYIKVNVWLSFGVIPMIPVALWFLSDGENVSRTALIAVFVIYIAAGIAVLASPWWTRPFIRRREEEITRLEQALAENKFGPSSD